LSDPQTLARHRRSAQKPAEQCRCVGLYATGRLPRPPPAYSPDAACAGLLLRTPPCRPRSAPAISPSFSSCLQLMRARMKRSSKRVMRNVGGGRVGARLIETGAQLLNQLPTIARLLSGCVDCKAQAGIGCVPLL